MFWLTAFVDLSPDEFDRGVAFWQAVTGYAVSPPRGPHDEFVSLVPPSGGVHLKLQRIGERPSKMHLDVHVGDPEAAAVAAEALGASVVLRHELGYVVMASPGGFVFCFVPTPEHGVPDASDFDGLLSAVDQLCLDVPEPAYETEWEFWEALTGWEHRPVGGHPEFRRLIRPDDQPLQLLLQRLDEQEGQVRAHLDLASGDRRAETERHLARGATVAAEGDGWTVMQPPAGPLYCITGRAPGMRVLPGDSTG
jgi:Glyoxalase-like domain